MSRLSLLFVLVCACDPSATEGDKPDTFIEPTGADCGEVETCGNTGLSESSDAEALSCILDAAAACEAAYATATQTTIEGDPITTTWQVAPDGAGGCEVQVTVDMTQDTYGGGYDFTRCETLTTEPDTCPTLTTEGCETVEP